jgi:hypothetical protein
MATYTTLSASEMIFDFYFVSQSKYNVAVVGYLGNVMLAEMA